MRRGYLTPPVMIILALITLGVALTLYFNTNLLKNIKNKSTPSSEPSVQDQPSPISDAVREPNDSAETANWKTYTNTQLGFSIKYPSSWFVYDNETPPCDKGIRGYLFVNKPALAVFFFFYEIKTKQKKTKIKKKKKKKKIPFFYFLRGGGKKGFLKKKNLKNPK